MDNKNTIIIIIVTVVFLCICSSIAGGIGVFMMKKETPIQPPTSNPTPDPTPNPTPTSNPIPVYSVKVKLETSMSNAGNIKNYLSECTAVALNQEYGPGLLCVSKNSVNLSGSNDNAVYYYPTANISSNFLKDFKIVKVVNDNIDPYFYIQSVRDDNYDAYLAVIPQSVFIMCNNISSSEHSNGWFNNKNMYYFTIKQVGSNSNITSISQIQNNTKYYIQSKGYDSNTNSYMAACNNRVIMRLPSTTDKLTETEFQWKISL